jgi:uncharacterized protein DUF4440
MSDFFASLCELSYGKERLMKTITYFLMIVGLGLAIPSPSRAQDAATRPIQDQPTVQTKETPSPTPTANPTPKASDESKVEPDVMPTAIPRAPPEKTEEKPAAKAEKKSAVKAESSPAATPEKPPAKTTVKPAAKAEQTAVAETTDGGGDRRADVAKLKALEKEWEASFSDPAVIEKSVADDFMGTSPVGKVITKRSLLREARSSSAPAPATVAHDLDVRFYGADIAVVVGGAKQTNKDKAGKKIVHNFRFTDTWVKRGGQWQCVASQSVLLQKR